jgi:hypothetical protein
MTKYVIFLDIDGVLNSKGYFRTDRKYLEYHKIMSDVAYRTDTKRFMRMNLDIASLRNLRFLMNSLPKNKQIIISSSWGKVFTLNQIKYAFRQKGFNDLAKLIKSITPRKMSSYRCNEVGWALSKVLENKKFTGNIRWITVDDCGIFSNSYLETVIYENDRLKVEYNPEYQINGQDGLLYTDALQILTMLIPAFRLR